jgi:hypothetical protein
MAAKRVLYFVLLLLLISKASYSQDKFGIGVSAIYNFQTEAVGVGARAEIGLFNRFSVVPQVMYFMPFNKVHELFGAVNFHYRVFYLGKFYNYLIAGGSANYWINYSESHWKKAKPFSVIAEVGAGMAYGDGKFRPFAEYRYTPLWKEGTIHVGIMYYPEWLGRSRSSCPAYQ